MADSQIQLNESEQPKSFLSLCNVWVTTAEVPLSLSHSNQSRHSLRERVRERAPLLGELVCDGIGAHPGVESFEFKRYQQILFISKIL